MSPSFIVDLLFPGSSFMSVPLNRLLLPPIALSASYNSLCIFSFLHLSLSTAGYLLLCSFFYFFPPILGMYLPFSYLWSNGMCMCLASHLWYGGSFPFFRQLWKYREDMRYALDTFLCRPPSPFNLSPLWDVQSIPASGASYFYCCQNVSSIHFYCWKWVHIINQELQRWGYRKRCIYAGGRKEEIPNYFSVLPQYLACCVWWHIIHCCTSFFCEMPASCLSKTAKLPLVSMWHNSLVSFATDGATASKPVLFLRLCHHTGNQVQGLSSYTHFFHTPFLVSACRSFCFPICFYWILVMGAA